MLFATPLAVFLKLNTAKNAGLLAAQILSVADERMKEKVISYKDKLSSDVMKKIDSVEKSFN